MAENTNDITLRIKIDADIKSAKARLEELAALGRQAAAAEVSSQDKSSVASGITDQILAMRKRANELEKEAKSEGGDTAFKETRNAATKVIRKYLNDTLKGIDADIAKEVNNLVGTKDKQNQILKQRAAAGGAAGGAAPAAPMAPPPMTKEAQQMQALAELRTRALAGGRQNEAFVRTLLGLDTETHRFSKTMEDSRYASAEYKKAAIDAAVSFRRGGSSILQGLAADKDYIKATANATAARQDIRNQAGIVSRGGNVDDLGGLSPAQIRDRYAAATSKERFEDTARQAKAAAASPEDIAMRARTRVATSELNSKVAAAAASTSGYIDDQERLRRSQREVADRLKSYSAGYTDEDIARRGGTESAAATASYVLAQRRRGQIAANITDDEIRQAAEERAAMAGVNNAIKLREKEILSQMIKSGELGGTFVQRKLAQWAPGTRTPADFAMGAEGLKSKAFTTLSYGASGVATGMLFAGVADAIKDASKLEATFVRMQDQLTTLGRGADFSEVRNGIKGISAETGVMATDVAEFSSRMFGVFGKDAQGNLRSTADIMKETSEAMKLMVVAGIDANTMMQSVIPTAKSFGVSIGEIGSAAVQVGEMVGISEEQVIEFLGKSATVAKQSGLEMRELAIVGATMGQNLGKPLQSSADVFNKMPELVQRNQDRIVQILRSSKVTEPFAEKVQEAIGKGEPGKAVLQIIRASALQGGLSTNALKELPKLLANPREIEEATAIIQNAKETVAKLDDQGFITAQGADALDNRFQKLQDTVSQTIERLKRGFEGLGESLFSLGLGDVFTELGHAAELAFGAIGLITGGINALNEATKSLGFESGLISPLLRFGVQAAIIAKVLSLLNDLRIKAIKLATGTATAEGTEAAARNVNTTAATREASSIEGANLARSSGGLPGAMGFPMAGAKNLITMPGALNMVPSRAAYASAPGFVKLPGVRSADFTSVKTVPVTSLPGGGAIYKQIPLKDAIRLSADAAAAKAVAESPAAINAASRASSAGYQFGQWGSTAGRASFLSRALSGGGTAKFNPLRQATMGANYSVEQAGGTAGLAGSGMLVPAAGITIAGIAAVYSTYSKYKDQLDSQSDTLRDQMRKADRAKLQGIVDAKSSFWDELSANLFGKDTPEEMARAAIAYQDATEGRESLSGLETAGATDRFVSRLNDRPEDIKKVEDFLNKDRETKRFAIEAGLGGTRGDDTEWKKFGAEDAFRDNTKIKVRPEDTKKLVDAARAAAEAGDKEKASQLAQLLGEDILNEPGMEDLKGSARAGRALNAFEAKMQEGGGPQAVLQKDFDAIKRDFQAGRIGSGDYLSKAKERLNQAKDDLANNIKDSKYREEQQAAVDQMETDVNQAENENVEGRYNTMASRIRLSGKSDSERRVSDLAIKTLPQYTKKEQFAKIPDIMSQLEKGFEEELASIADPVQRARRSMEGFKVPDALRQLEVEADLSSSTTFGPEMTKMATAFGVTTEAFTAQIAAKVLNENLSVIDAINKMFQERRKKIAESIPETMTDIFKKSVAGSEIDNGKVSDEEISSLLDIGGAPVQQLLGGASGFFNTDILGMANMVLAKAQEWDVSTAEALRRILVERRDALIAAGGDPTFMNSLIESITGAFTGAKVEEPPEVAHQKAQEARRKALADVAEGQKADIEARAQRVRGDPLAQANAELDQAWVDYGVENQLLAEGLGDINAKKNAFNRVLKAQAAVEDAGRELALMKFDWAEFNAGDDKSAAAEARLQKLQAELAYAIADSGGNMNTLPVQQKLLEIAKAQKDLTDSTVDTVVERARAQSSLLSAINERDPVKVAQIALDQAKLEVANAKNEAERLNALAEQVRAEHGLEDAMSEVFASRAELAIALAEVAGNPVKVAELQVKEAKRKLDEAVSQNRGEAEINQLTGQYATAQENAAHTARTEEESIIDFQLQMRQITTDQAISGLKLILSRTKFGTDEYRQLAQKIDQLEQQAGQDLQFNLPSNISLPTLYEARRMNQGTAAGIGYMDNRNIALTFNVDGAQDPAAVSAQIMTALQGAMGGGQLYTPGVSTGALN